MQSSTYSIPCQSFVSVADKSLFGRRQGRLLPAGLLRINLSSLPSSDPLIGAFAMRKALYFSCAISLAISFPVRIVHAEDWATRCNALAGSPIEPGNADRGIAFEKIDPQPALAACQNALRSDPDSAAILFRIGRAYHKNNEPLRAFRYEGFKRV